jgi:hypothetical protein
MGFCLHLREASAVYCSPAQQGGGRLPRPLRDSRMPRFHPRRSTVRRDRRFEFVRGFAKAPAQRQVLLPASMQAIARGNAEEHFLTPPLN